MKKRYIEDDKLAKIKLTKSVRISMLDLEELEDRGISVAEALRVGLDMVLGRADAPVSAPISAPGDGMKPEVAELWAMHKGYLDAELDAERASLGSLESAWVDFIIALDEINEKPPKQLEDYYKECFAKVQARMEAEMGV